jgi:hypothetical protein
MSTAKRKAESAQLGTDNKKTRSDQQDIFDLGGKKKASVSVFKGKALVNIREYYLDKATGEEKPGSKGIALNVEQWEALVALVSVNFHVYCNLGAYSV